MPKKYELPENEPQMVCEPIIAVQAEAVQHRTPIADFDMQQDDEWLDDFCVPSLQIPVEELKERIAKGIEDYHNGEFFTQEEAHAYLDRWTKVV